MMKLMSRFVREEEGQGLAEYGLILALIAVVVATVLGNLGEAIIEVFEEVTESFE